MNIKTKKCKKCDKIKNIDDFIKSKTTKDGHTGECKVCHHNRISKRRKERIEKGLCVVCGKENKTKNVLCKSCSDKRNEWSRKNPSDKSHAQNLRKFRKENNLCIDCGKKKKNTLVRCKKCNDKVNHHNKILLKNRKQNGLCTMCGKSKSKSRINKTLCLSCSKKQNKFLKEINKERKQNNLCIACGKPALQTFCKECSNKKRIQRKKLEKNRVKNGLCRICGKDAIFSGTSCLKCFSKRKSLFNKTRDKWKKNGLCVSCGKNKDTENLCCEKCSEKRKLSINKDRVRAWERKQRKENIQYKLACNLRVRLNRAMKHNLKAGSAVKDLGCSIDDFKSYLEKLFLPNMSWDNYGNGNDKWNIDHIIPLHSVDLTNRDDFLKVCHYTNLRPLWQPDNQRRNRKDGYDF